MLLCRHDKSLSLMKCCGIVDGVQPLSSGSPPGLYRGVCAAGEYRGASTRVASAVGGLSQLSPPRSVRESGEQRAQIEPRDDVQVRRQVACSALPARQPARSQLSNRIGRFMFLHRDAVFHRVGHCDAAH